VGFSSEGSGFAALAEVWNGTGWRAQRTALPQGRQRLGAISCAAAGTCTAVGAVTPKGAGGQPLAEGE
jgi:hypothetical protein